MNDHNTRRGIDEEQDTEIQQVLKELKEIRATLDPIAKTYSTVTALGKWGMAFLVLVSVVIGILLGLRKLITHTL